MWELVFMAGLVLVGAAGGYLFSAAWEPRLTAAQITAAVTWDDNDEMFFRRVVDAALDAGGVSALTAGDVRQVVLAALDEHRDKAVARVSRRITKSGKRKAVR